MNTVALLFRQLRFLRDLRGWKRLVQAVVPRDASSAFRVTNKHGVHSGDLSDFIQRQLYLYGGYEWDEIDGYLAMMPQDRRGVALDIGANMGVHSVAFAQAFDRVLSFEPNPQLWPVYERMQADNGADNMVLNRCALGAQETTLPLFLANDYNLGMGTLVQEDQYQQPLYQTAEVPVRVGDALLTELGVSRVDAIKMDVQGFEVEVIRGLRGTIERDRPILWIELAEGLHQTPEDRALLDWLMQDRAVYRFVFKGTLMRRAVLERCDGDALVEADYVLI